MDDMDDVDCVLVHFVHIVHVVHVPFLNPSFERTILLLPHTPWRPRPQPGCS